MTPIKEHKCELLPSYYEIIKFYDCGWVLNVGDDCGDIYDFKYCPYCGIKLE
jgi:hypothetical protein